MDKERCTSLSRAMLAWTPKGAVDAYLAHVELNAMTDRTVVSAPRLKEISTGGRKQGCALIDEELEVGLRSIAVPVRGASCNVITVLNVGAQTARITTRQMKEEFLPVLLRGARELGVLLP
jgi:IclR family transcriptional regulator, pca regulon regulatory protein